MQCLSRGVPEGAWSREACRRRVGGRSRSFSVLPKSHCAKSPYARRWPDGFVCPARGKGRAVTLKSRPRLFECLAWGRQTSITTGTEMHRSKLPLRAWFWAAHAMATHSNGMSARQSEDQLGVTYRPA